MEIIDRDRYRLKSGKEFAANNGIIGLSPDLELEDFWICSECQKKCEITEVKGDDVK